MTRVHALAKLLEHGRMGYAEIMACTRWSRNAVEVAIRRCTALGSVRRLPAPGRDGRKYEYEATGVTR